MYLRSLQELASTVNQRPVTETVRTLEASVHDLEPGLSSTTAAHADDALTSPRA